MICKYRITLDGIKGFFRLYKVNKDSTLYTFHKQIRSDLEFPMDQPILFKAFDADGNVIARYALAPDLGYGVVDEVTIAKTISDGAVKFVYFYDIASKKSVTITLEGEEPGSVKAPTIVESKGPLPIEFEKGYVAFEDLPENPRKFSPIPLGGDEDEDGDSEGDDDEDDEDEKDPDKEEEEIIYDENE